MSIRHPPVKSFPDGGFLATTICEFAREHKPEIKYEQMINALDSLTACWSLNKIPCDFHYEIMDYKNDGVYIKRVEAKGHRTSQEQMKQIINHRLQEEKDEITRRVKAKIDEMANTISIEGKLVTLWEKTLEGTKNEKLIQLTERVTGLLLLHRLSGMVENGIINEL